jgi:hypothetical protein
MVVAGTKPLTVLWGPGDARKGHGNEQNFEVCQEDMDIVSDCETCMPIKLLFLNILQSVGIYKGDDGLSQSGTKQF